MYYNYQIYTSYKVYTERILLSQTLTPSACSCRDPRARSFIRRGRGSPRPCVIRREMLAGNCEVVPAGPEHLDAVVSLYAETAEWHVALDPAYYVPFDDEAAAIRDSYYQVLHDTSGEVLIPLNLSSHLVLLFCSSRFLSIGAGRGAYCTTSGQQHTPGCCYRFCAVVDRAWGVP